MLLEIKTMEVFYVLSILLLIPIIAIWHLKNKSAIYRICFISVSLGVLSILIASSLHWGPGLILMVGAVIMIVLPLAVLLFHNLQKENLHKMIKDEIANELNQIKAKDL